jgi:RNA polymerase sigma-70 factor (ECF subfamily)
MSREDIVKGCIKNNIRAQRALYDLLAPLLYGICLRYVRDNDDAEELMQQSLVKIFGKIKQLKEYDSLERWAKRVAVNTSLNFIRRESKFKYTQLPVEELNEADHKFIATHIPSDLETEDLLMLLRGLPAGCRTVFNLYHIDGYSHQEIAAMLGVSVNTSKSQTLKARRNLQKLIEKFA